MCTQQAASPLSCSPRRADALRNLDNRLKVEGVFLFTEQ